MKTFFALIVILAGLSCTKKQNINKSIVLKVDSVEMNTETFAKKLSNQLKHLDAFIVKDPSFVGRIKRKIIKDFIINAISIRWAENNQIFVRTEEINQEIDKIRSNYGDDISFREELAKEQMTLKEWKVKIRNKLLQDKILANLRKTVSKPTDKEIRTYYKNRQEEFFRNESRKIRQVVLKTEADAKIVRKKLKRGTKIEDLISFSVTPEAKNGGHLGWIEKGVFPVYDKVFKMRVGATSKILESEYGFHIIQVLGKRKKGAIPFSEVKKEIYNRLMEKREQARYVAWLDEQIRKVKVYKNDEIIKKITVVTKGNS